MPTTPTHPRSRHRAAVEPKSRPSPGSRHLAKRIVCGRSALPGPARPRVPVALLQMVAWREPLPGRLLRGSAHPDGAATSWQWLTAAGAPARARLSRSNRSEPTENSNRKSRSDDTGRSHAPRLGPQHRESKRGRRRATPQARPPAGRKRKRTSRLAERLPTYVDWRWGGASRPDAVEFAATECSHAPPAPNGANSAVCRAGKLRRA